jgi:polyferredoxin
MTWPQTQTGYPVQFSVDHPDRPLNRLTTAFRIFLVIPIAIVLSTVSGYLFYSAPTHAYGVTYIPALTGGVLFWAPLLMILSGASTPGGGSTGTSNCSGSPTGSPSTCR